MRRHLSPGRLAAAGLVLLALVLGLLLLAPAGDTYIFLPGQARPIEPLLEIEGADGADEDGGFYLVDVSVRKATLMERIWPGIREGASLVPAHAINPTGLSEPERRAGNLRQMSRSQAVAAAVALREAGYEVDADPSGAFVAAVLPDRPAAGVLQPTDVIVAVDGEEVETPADLRELLSAQAPGSRVELRLLRGEETLERELVTEADPRDAERSVIGILVEQAAEIELPLEVEIDTGSIGGPSAGLPLALAVLEELGEEVDGGLRVAATGELELDGSVQPVGGVEQKTVAVRRAGIDVFVVPAGENAEQARRHANGLRIVPVESFQQALRALATLAEAPAN